MYFTKRNKESKDIYSMEVSTCINVYCISYVQSQSTDPWLRSFTILAT